MKRLALFVTSTAVLVSFLGTDVRAEGNELTEADVKQVVKKNFAEIRSCYTTHAVKQKKATGKVKLDLVVDKSGEVRKGSINVAAEGVEGKKFERCVVASVRSWTFPKIDHSTAVQYPFFFLKTHARGAGPKR